VSAVKHFKKFCSPDHPKGAVDVVQSASKVVNGLYQLLIQKRASLPKRSEEKWLPQGKAIGISGVTWKNTYRLPCLCSTETKLKVFLFKLLHGRIATNDFF